jgi:DNA polymerase-1
MTGSTQGDLFGHAPAATPSRKKPAPAKTVLEAALPVGPPTITLIDASGFIFRAYHALPGLTTSKGVPTHAVLGFTRMVLKLLRERQPAYVALCFDKNSRRGRLAIDPNYKANREAPPEDLRSQVELIRKVAQVLALPIIEFDGWEADDVIATLVKRARAEGYQSLVVTSDKDFLQLAAEDVALFDPMKDRMLDEAYALGRYGVRPSKMRDFLALVGDAIDNIPKVPGIGPKTAVDLITQFGGVEELLTRLGEVARPKIREALIANAEQLKMAYALVGFRDDLDLPVPLDSLKRGEIHQPEARTLFTELEFYRLISEMPSAPATPLEHEATVVGEAAGLDAIAAALATAEEVGLSPAFEGPAHSAELLGLAVKTAAACWYVDVPAVTPAEVKRVLGPALTRAGLVSVAHDGKELHHLLHSVGIDLTRVDDVELVSYLLNPSRKEHALLDMARERLRVELPVEGPPELRHAGAADAVLRLRKEVWAEADGMGLAEFARNLELPLMQVLVKMERAGVRVDPQALAGISTQVEAMVKSLQAEVTRIAGKEFNVGSPQQLAQVLFEDLKLPVLKRTRTGPSTDHEVLEKLAESHPLPQAIIEYRNVSKLKSTYLDTLPKQIGADGRIRTTFHQAATATGRLTSSDPNLQNIPIRTELGKSIRQAFVAEPGWSLVSADYSQIELRILAHVSEDPALIAAFHGEIDVHRRTAAEVFGVPPAEVTDVQRRTAKMINYGIAYGLGAPGLALRLRIPAEEARSIIERYFERFPGIRGYVDGTIELARKHGYVETIFGRRRYMPDIVSKNRNISMAAERAAINMPIQGTAADLLKRAMLRLDVLIPERGLNGRMLLQVHDELLFECPLAEVPAMQAVAKEVMTSAAELRVPLIVDVGAGRSWAEAH